MANQKISQFQVVTSLNGTTYIPVIQGSPLFDAIVSASNFASSMQTYNDVFYIKVDGTNSNITQLNFNTSALEVALEAGEVRWNATNGTLEIGMNGGLVIQSIGLELYNRLRATETITDGMLVMFAGTDGNSGVLKASLATPNCDPDLIVGIATESASVNDYFFATWYGKISGLQTNGGQYGETWVDGDKCYQHPSVSGGFTKTRPTFGNKVPYIAIINAHNSNGHMFARVQRSLSINGVNDVNIVNSNRPIIKDASGHIVETTAIEVNSITPPSGLFLVNGDIEADGILLDTIESTSADFASATIDELSVTSISSSDGFAKVGSTNSYVHLGAGGTKAIADFVLQTEKGVANGVATLDSNGFVPSTQLPSYVDDSLEYANLASFPAVGETGKIYVALDTNKTYRWSGSVYIYITSGAVDSVAGKTGVVTLVKGDVGLGNVDNTSDANKPVSTAQQTALNGKVNNTGNETIAGIKTFSSSPIVPTPTTSTQVANKAYVDSIIVTADMVEQEPGTSTTNVLSQKAVADYYTLINSTIDCGNA